MYRALVIDSDAANRLSLAGSLEDDWVGKFDLPPDVVGIRRIVRNEIIYLIGTRVARDCRLLVIGGRGAGFFPELPKETRLECFFRILKVALSRFQPLIRIPVEWRLFHSGSLISFQTNRWSTQIRSRAYVDFAPEGTDHVYAYWISTDENEALTRAGYDADLFETAALTYDTLNGDEPTSAEPSSFGGQLSIALTQNFSDSNIAQGIPFSVWRDSKLTKEQRAFFDAPFEGPLRVRGAAGTGKTLVLTLRFLREIYAKMDGNQPVRALFLAHGQETADNIRTYLMLIDERNLLTDPQENIELQITTLHSIANDFVNYDAERIQPLSLDGSEGRTLQFELVQSLVRDYASAEWLKSQAAHWSDAFRAGLLSSTDSESGKAFCCDLIDEFTNVLETFGVRDVDEIAERYLKSTPSPRALAHSAFEKHPVLELYRQFRSELASMGVISLDQFIADFLAYLNSFRWDAVRARRGFDFVFADELHLFNRQERPVLGYLLRDHRHPRRVAVAYDPRQSPRNSFFPEARNDRDNIWSEARLETGARQFELTDVFRYTPQILRFLHLLNEHFPADDLAEEWGLTFGTSKVADGPLPRAIGCATRDSMGYRAANRARELMLRAKRGQRVAVLTPDHARFTIYREAGVFRDGFVTVSSRDQIGVIQRYGRRAVLSMPEYVAGLQFDSVLLIDTNASLVAELGGGANGLQRFISSIYLGASRAKTLLELYADATAGGFAQPIREAMDAGLVTNN